MANGKLRVSIGLTLHAASPEDLRDFMIKGIESPSLVRFVR